jgi:hypothetical protein
VPLDDDLDTIERSIRQLQIEWEKFFSGIEKKPPMDMKTRLERLIRKYAGEEIRNNTERFRYQTLTARYATFNELWSKRLRAMEEGRPVVHLPRHAPPAAAPAATPAAAAAAAAASARAGSEYRVRNPTDSDGVRALFDRYMEARRQAGDEAPVKFESFQKIISQQADRILKEKGGQAVDFRLETKDGKVSLKAKAVK